MPHLRVYRQLLSKSLSKSNHRRRKDWIKARAWLHSSQLRGKSIGIIINWKQNGFRTVRNFQWANWKRRNTGWFYTAVYWCHRNRGGLGKVIPWEDELECLGTFFTSYFFGEFSSSFLLKIGGASFVFIVHVCVLVASGGLRTKISFIVQTRTLWGPETIVD